MAKSKWSDLQVGDFFAMENKDTFYNTAPWSLYQKLEPRYPSPYNAVLLDSGQLCCVSEESFTYFERVEVTFEVKPIE